MRQFTPHQILDFWFHKDNAPNWFKKNEDFDRTIFLNFHSAFQRAKIHFFDSWKHSPKGALALIILLDQFPRNMFRDMPEAFATDKLALNIANYALKKKFDTMLSKEEQKFLFMPFMHSESLNDQSESIRLFTQLGDKLSLDFAKQHKDIIEKFGRFPHRNDALGRISTEEEFSFLEGEHSRF